MRSGNNAEKIVLAYGDRQTFRYRCEDIHFAGFTALTLPTRRSEWRLNGGAPIHFYIERQTTEADPRCYPWDTRTPAVNRLLDLPGHFNIEIPVESPQLRAGHNRIGLAIEGQDGVQAQLEATFTWDPSAPGLPLHVSDLSKIQTIQDVAQVVDGLWDVDRAHNAIKTRAPVAADSLCLLGAPHASQEATYDVEFSSPLDGFFVGLSDFFVRHDEQVPSVGIKPGYSSAGLATLRPGGFAECWVAMGDNTWENDWAWVRKTRIPAVVSIAAGVVYTVRHQVIFDGGTIVSRFRLWRAGRPEPKGWLCTIDTASLSPNLPRPTAASFGLFQHRGNPTRWSNIKLRSIPARITPEDLVSNHPAVAGWNALRYYGRRLSQRARRKVRNLVGD